MVVLKIFYFHPDKLGKMNPFWRAYVSDGLKPPTSWGFWSKSRILHWKYWFDDAATSKICKLVSHDDPVLVSLSSYKWDDSKKKDPFRWTHKKWWFSLRKCLKDMHTIVFSSPWIVQRPFIQIRVHTRHTTERMQTMPFPLKFDEYGPRLAIFRRECIFFQKTSKESKDNVQHLS